MNEVVCVNGSSCLVVGKDGHDPASDADDQAVIVVRHRLWQIGHTNFVTRGILTLNWSVAMQVEFHRNPLKPGLPP
jgi:hypothetical protein